MSWTEDEKSSGEVRVEEAGRIEIDPVAERKLVRKLDWIILPLFSIIYCANFVDRTAIGNAKIAGIEKDLGMKGFDFNITLTAFYIFYLTCEVPSNLALKHLGSKWLAGMVVAFGAVSIGTAFVKNFNQLLVTRVFLGISESGTLPGLGYILSRYYRRKEFVLRMGIFMGVSAASAGAFGGLLASAILRVNDMGPIKSWRKIFFVEGLITVILGILCFWILPNDPRHTRMLTEEERALALARIDADQAVQTQGRREKATPKLVVQSMTFSTIICSTAFLLINISFQGLSLFLPTVVSGLGKFTVIEAQLRTVPPYVIGALWALIASYASFRLRNRYIPMLSALIFQVIGYAIAIVMILWSSYAACFLCVAGGTPTGPMLISWGTDNSAPDTARAVATAMIPGIGALGAVIAVWTYLPYDSPNYRNGNTLNLVASTLAWILVVIYTVYLFRENKFRERGGRDHRLEGKSQEELEQLGHLHPSFRYQL